MDRTPQQKFQILLRSAESQGLTGTDALLKVENCLGLVNQQALQTEGEREVYLAILQEMDAQPGMDQFRANDRLKTAYDKLASCDVTAFWDAGLPKLTLLRESIWQQTETTHG